MYKADLKRLWGLYCDTDKLVDDAMELLTKYNHTNTEYGVCEMLHTYFTNKKKLIDMFVTSKNYIGDMRICLDVELERRNETAEILGFCKHFAENVGVKEIFLKYTDEYGKTLDDYTRTGLKHFNARDLHYRNVAERLCTNSANRDKFNIHDGATFASHAEFDKFSRLIERFSDNPRPILNENIVDYLTQHKMNATFVEGMKTSRAFNRVCSCYGVDKLQKYNKLFAQYADMVSGLKRKVKFYMSLNPLDYLTMSFGNSWSSCHTIDKTNKRGMPDSYRGMHCGGTMSYMLDGTSIVTFVHNTAMENYEDGKLYRNMFHFYEGTLVQGRVYPQGNDGATDLYTEFRRIVQQELADLLNLESNDWYKRNRSCGDNTATYGVHYADYIHFDSCNVSYPKEMPSAANNVVVIGHERICVNCGELIDDDYDSGYLNHYDCENT